MKKLFYFSSTLILSILLLEACLFFYSKFQGIIILNDDRFSKLLKAYEEGKIFKHQNNFFTYEKNIKNKRYINYYVDGNIIKKVWDYRFSTNNIGLVQKNDIKKNIKSILFLGDSFTEGNGSPPWVDKFNGKIREYQVINGAFQGTGFKQFYNFEQFISELFSIEYVIVLYIGGDVRRGIVMPKNTKCVESFKNCTGQEKYIGIPKGKKFNIKSVEKFLTSYNNDLKINDKLKIFIRDTYIYTYLRSEINMVRLKNNKTIENNLQSLLKLKNTYKDKIFFIRINTAEEIVMKKKSYESNLINRFMKKNKIQNYFCDMENNINYFYKYDYHPNQKGYDILFKCVNNILDTIILN